MINIVLALTVAAATTQKDETKFSILLFVAMCLSYDLASEYIESDYIYYLAAAFTDLAIIALLSKISKPNSTILLLQKICLYFIYINLIGFIVYLTGLPPAIYSLSCELLYMTVLIIAIFEDSNYGKYRDSIMYSSIRSAYSESFRLLCRNQTTFKDGKAL